MGNAAFSGIIWRNLLNQRKEPSLGKINLFDRLSQGLDFGQYRPARNPEAIEQRLMSEREGEYYVIKNPSQARYLKLTPRDYFLWESMDGTKTVKDLVVAYFLNFGTFALERVKGLVEQLKAEGFLKERAAGVFAQADRQLKKERLEYRATKLKQLFFQKSFSIHGIDGILEWVYKNGLWLLFARPAKLFYPLVTIVGLGLFIDMFRMGSYSLAQTAGSYSLGILTYIGINIFAVIIHEGAHALATKSYGREVRRAGFLFYYGVPGFFADTSDIWLEGKGKRLAVSFAGPYAETIVAGACSCYVYFFPASPISPLLFKLAFFSYLSFFINMNPLLELDGYYLLMDWLEVPLLRKKALNFIKTGLVKKLMAREEFKPEEKLYAVFGVLAAIWSGLAILISLYFLRWRMGRVFQELFRGVGWLSRGLSLLVLSLFIVPVVASLLAMVYLGAKKAGRWLSGFSLWQDNRRLAFVLGALSFLLSLSSVFISSSLSPLFVWGLQLAGLLLALFFGLKVVKDYSGSRLWWGHLAFSGFIAFLLIMNLFPFQPWDRAQELAAMALLFFSASVVFQTHPFLYLSRAEQIIIALAPLGAFILSLPLVTSSPGPVISLSIYLGALSFAMLLPNPTNYIHTQFIYPWSMILTGVGFFLVGNYARHWPPLGQYLPAGAWEGLLSFSYLLIASGLFIHHLVYKRITFVYRAVPDLPTESDRERLADAFKYITGKLMEHFRVSHGHRRAGTLMDHFNRHALSCSWRLLLMPEGIVDRGLSHARILEMEEEYRRGLAHLATLLARESGWEYVQKNLIGIYDHLYWEERELASDYLFRGQEWAGRLSHAFQDKEINLRELIARIPFLKDLDEESFQNLRSVLMVERFEKGQAAVRQGEAGDKFYLIRSGRFEVWVRDQAGRENKVAELKRGDYFGEIALLRGVPRTATVKCAAPAQCLVVARADFDRLLRVSFLAANTSRSTSAIFRLLRQMPLFLEFSLDQVARIAERMRTRKYPASATIIQQGEPGNDFYVIVNGEVEVVLTKEEDSAKIKVGQLGPGEFFGEIALLMEVPRTATVVARTEVELAALEKRDFQEILKKDAFATKSLEMVSSRRLYQVRRELHQPALPLGGRGLAGRQP